MSWPYQFVDLSDEEKIHRSHLLRKYAATAQLSALVPISIILAYRWATWFHAERKKSNPKYSAVPNSPTSKRQRKTALWSLPTRWRLTVWWLQGEVRPGWGLRSHWIAGGCWTAWLLLLCTLETGHDYLHITKRFGIIAVSQLPIHYMLAMKSLYSPFSLIFNSSVEELNPWHRTLGRIIYSILILHASWYMNFFVQKNLLATRLTAGVVIVGMVSFSSFTILSTTALGRMREWNYRVFFIVHVVVGVSVLPLLCFHAESLQLYVAEAFILFVVDIIGRKLDTVTSLVKVTRMDNTNLVKLTIPISSSKIARFKAAPAQLVYLQIPPESTPANRSPAVYNFLYNPFTVAHVSEKYITLVLRALDGPLTTALNALVDLPKAKPPVNIEGPVGLSRNFPRFAEEFDRILIIAGGIGATFAFPIYQKLRTQVETESNLLASASRISFVWSVKSEADYSWAVDLDDEGVLANSENVKIHVTGSVSEHASSKRSQDVDGAMELDHLKQDTDSVKLKCTRKRPNFGEIVDNTFKLGGEERVAVLVCGPVEMARELRGHVGRWVSQGRQVWWHSENFSL